MRWKCASWMSLLAIMAVDVVATTIGIIVPSGSSYGAMNDRIHGSITSNATVPTDVLIGLRFVGDKTVPEVSPNPVVLQAGTSMANFSIVGRSPGRFHVDWELLSMGSPSPFNESSPMYALSSSSGAFVVFILNNQWPSVFYQVGLNVFVLVLGLGYFAWRRTSHVSIPFWGAHVEGLFRPVPFRTDEDTAASSSISEEDPQDPLDAASLRDRFLRFWRLPIDDKLVVDRCGMETALCLHFLRDAGHVFVGLSVLSTVILVPINYVSGGAVTQSYQEATISNVPMGSHWFWGHVGMCYLSSAAVFWFVYRQHERLSKLHRDDPTLVGPRSVFIQAGLPPYISSRTLFQHLSQLYPSSSHDVESVRVVDDLSHVYQILGQRMALRNEARRLMSIYGSASIPMFVRWCPGTSCMPSPTDLCYDYAAGLPCRRRRRPPKDDDEGEVPLGDAEHGSSTSSNPGDFVSIQDDNDVLPPRIQRRLQFIYHELERYPHELLTKFKARKGTGAAFVVFRSTAAKKAFLEHAVATQSPATKLRAHVAASLFRVQQHLRRHPLRHRFRHPSSPSLVESLHSSPLSMYLPQLILQPAPEPNDIRWPNLISRPRSLKRTLVLVFYQGLTMTILLLFSTPASVLLYVNLDPSSPLYTKLLEDTSIVTGFLRSYLPTLLLVTVNALLLVVLFYLSIFEPWITETKRMRSLLIKAYIYLVLSSILFPSIGVTAVYATSRQSKVNPLDFQQSTQASYVNSFLFNVCSNFFILYLSQLICVGTVVQILRTAERVIYQPWLRARAVTSSEIVEACRPAPFYFGVEYALYLSAFLVTLLGTTLSPALVPCGATYFYTRLLSTKYNVLFVHPKAPGRGHVTRSVLSLVLASVLLFQIAMALILSQLGRREHWIAVSVLACATLGVIVWWHATVHAALEDEDRQAGDDEEEGRGGERMRRMSSSLCLSMLLDAASHDAFLRGVPPPPAYQNPYDTGLKLFAALHRIFQVPTSSHELVASAWNRWKQTALHVSTIKDGKTC